MLMSEVRTLIKDAFEGDPDAINEVYLAANLQRAMWGLMAFSESSDRGPRNALVVLGHIYFGLSVTELGEIMGISYQAITKIIEQFKHDTKRNVP